MRNWIMAGLLALTALPSLPALAEDDNEPQIIISHQEDKTFYEYRVNGAVVEIKVVPKHGKPYYLVPVEGKGMVESDHSRLRIPQWVIFQW
ncbi:hypothetical protein WH50_01530 [Pokkaliibacter plantistimulans]|uniref:DUF2782 domain-containing protein n=2 Tax=Pseudomonadota TaxID=1224 RepID=A0ABX5M211_9GAMM|nr:DUF2782 domain-containing protein [Pokkaliibacter plantistimulans]PPC78173.1 DUF2782 domain-containing protein [Pokkaliibacter plantistimulans]PXF32966.1 hypothetical protein WH50_01530 [Pokkaliibacter plantistimulans]